MESSLSPGLQAVKKAMATQNSDLGYFDYKLGKKGRSIVVYAPVISVRTGLHLDKSKTIGVITTRNETDILQAAYSGWTSGADQDHSCLDSNKWNYIALHQIASELRFRFPGNQRDNGRLRAEDYAVETLRKAYPEESDDWLVANLKKLKYDVRLGQDRRIAIITIDSQPCRPCLQFITLLQQHTGLTFIVNGGSGVGPTIVRIEGRRRYDTFGDTFEDSSRENTPSGDGKAVTDRIMDDMVVIEIGSEDSDSDVTMREESPVPSSGRTEYGHRRGRMDWPQALPVRDTASRVPENSDELVAEYKKKTPVWEFPGYCSSVQQAARQTASLGWQYARGAYDAITRDADADPDNDEGGVEEFEEIGSEEVAMIQGELERSENRGRDGDGDGERGLLKRPRDEDEFEELGDDDDNEVEETQVQEMPRPRDFNHWRYKSSGKTNNNASVFRTRFPFLNTRFGV
ncbi:hypothetical protein F4775DRAFT_593258 [Biscogniauxia sp. FL1348]|nr:hypothetical protein F4775DRAFT_593258 [Biscogniauxia sp. FL1348]